MRNSKVVDKAHQRATKKTARLVEKEKVLSKEKNSRRTSKQPVPESSTVD